MLAQSSLQKSPEVDGPRKGLVCGSHRQQAIGIDELESRWNLCGGRRDHARQEKARIVITDDDTSFRRERRQQASSLSYRRLDIGIVRRRPSLEPAGIVGHALD